MARSRAFFFARVSVLAGVLLIVLLYAWHDVTKRRERNQWERGLTYGFVVVRVGAVDDAAIARLGERRHDLEERLKSEFARRGGTFAPIRFSAFGPVDAATPPPPPPGEGLLALLRHTWERRRWLAGVDARAGVDPRGLDGRLYVVVTPARGDLRTVEGLSEQGGTVGIAIVQLDDDMVDLACFVAAHELFHTLGASDEYDELGRVRDPGGFAEPNASPRFPQRWAEVMSRGRPIAPGVEVSPERLDELAVGDQTAREIGWLR